MNLIEFKESFYRRLRRYVSIRDIYHISANSSEIYLQNGLVLKVHCDQIPKGFSLKCIMGDFVWKTKFYEKYKKFSPPLKRIFDFIQSAYYYLTMEQDVHIVSCDPGLFRLHMLQYYPYSKKQLPLYLHVVHGVSKLRYLIYRKVMGQEDISIQQLVDETKHHCVLNLILLKRLISKWSADRECLFLLPRAQQTRILRRDLKLLFHQPDEFKNKLNNWFSLLYALSVFALHDALKILIKPFNVRLYYVDECQTSNMSQLIDELGYSLVKVDTTKYAIEKDGYVLAWYDKNELACLNILYHFRKEIKDLVIADDYNFLFYYKQKHQTAIEYNEELYDFLNQFFYDRWYFKEKDIMEWVNA